MEIVKSRGFLRFLAVLTMLFGALFFVFSGDYLMDWAEEVAGINAPGFWDGFMVFLRVVFIGVGAVGCMIFALVLAFLALAGTMKEESD